MIEARITRSNPAESLALALIHASRAPVLLLDAGSKVVGASATFCGEFGLRPQDMDGRSLAQLGAGEWNTPRLRSLLRTTFAGTAAVDAYEMDLVRPGHPDACIVLNAHRLDYDQEAPLIVLTATDVTLARHELRLKDEMIKEKQVLLQELQHRVANSLQIIASVLMQSARRVQSEETRMHLHNAHHRVLSIATLQQQLAVSTDDQVALGPYFVGLCESIGASMIDDDGRITLHATADDATVTAGVATSLGLIVTELVINALKHAFPDRTLPGEIAVDYHELGLGFALTVTDNGIGIPKNAKPARPGLGTGIVDALATQLGATVERTDCAPGMKVAVVRAV